jgi:hypothetical protein
MRRGVLIVLLAALLGPVASAAAEPLPLLPPLPRSHELTPHGEPVQPVSFFRSGFVVDAGHGYKLGVSTLGGSVYAEVWRGRNGQRTSTAYLAHGVGTPERLQATFGQFGKVSMRFRESRNRTWFGRPRTCRGANRFIQRRGTFHGSFRFRGEDGFVSVRVHRAKGAVVIPAPKCKHRKPSAVVEALSSSAPAALVSIARDGVDSTGFLAFEGRKSTVFVAADEEARNKVAIVRFAVLRRPIAIHSNEALTAVTVSPSAPFHGTGRYRAAPDGSTTWSGNLSVSLPGAPRTPLTGPDFETFVEVPF